MMNGEDDKEEEDDLSPPPKKPSPAMLVPLPGMSRVGQCFLIVFN